MFINKKGVHFVKRVKKVGERPILSMAKAVEVVAEPEVTTKVKKTTVKKSEPVIEASAETESK